MGCGAAAIAPMAVTWAQPPPGQWQCFAVEGFPDIQKARAADNAANIGTGLNQVAAHVPAGTVLAVTPYGSGSGSYASVACVKY